MTRICFRVDSSPEIGLGHVMRCLALGQTWQDAGGKVVVVMATRSPGLETRIQQEKMEVIHLAVLPGSTEDARQTAILATEQKADWLVVDGYVFGADYQRCLKESGMRLLCLDDYGHSEYYYADVVLNQNIHSQAETYQAKEPYTRLLLGTQYALLRREFWSWRHWNRPHQKQANNVLVTIGGSDFDNVTEKVLQGLELIGQNDLEVTVVAGGANPHYQRLTKFIKQCKHRIKLILNATNMPELMARADLAISAGGSTCWELAFMGLPDIVIIVSKDQRPIAEKLGELQVVMNLGWHETLTSRQIGRAAEDLSVSIDARTAMSGRGQELVDGRGGSRVLQAMRNL